MLSLEVLGQTTKTVVRSNQQLLDVANRLRAIAEGISDPKIRSDLAAQIERILDLAQENDRAVRAAIGAAG